MLTFGRAPTFQTSDAIDFAVSEDGRALTIEFGSSGFDLDANSSSAPVSTGLFCVVIPLEGDDKNAEIEFIASTSVIASNRATAALVLSVNGQSVVADFPAQDQEEQSFVTVLKYAADKPPECRLVYLFLGGRESVNADSRAHLHALSIDAEILPRPPGPHGRPVRGPN